MARIGARIGLGITGRTLLVATLAVVAVMVTVSPTWASDAGAEAEHNLANAETLVPSGAAMGWYGPMLYGVLGLFAAAIVVGVARDAGGMKDPGIAAGEYDQAHAHHDDHADSHGHDDHGHAAHGHKH
jgi:hypothetical protein